MSQAKPNRTERELRMTPERNDLSDGDLAIQLFPTFAYPIDRGSVWRLMVQGRICQNVPPSLAKRLMLRGFIRAMDLEDHIARGPIFTERIHGFLVAPVARRRVQVTLENQTHVLPRKSKSSGLFACKLDVPKRLLAKYRTYGSDFEPTLDAPELRIQCDQGLVSTSSGVFLAQERGISVISDIDDTIKLTDVCSRRRMLRRTFAEPFESLPGMSHVYQQWAQSGALFHYVSSSPWQIFDALHEFLLTEGFPMGSMHLKWFRLRDEIFKRWSIVRRKSKVGVIRGMIKRMPQRLFVLVGDSGEKDPEMYAKIALKHPKQVVRICIRQIEENPIDAARLAKIYRRYGMSVPIQVFSDPGQLGPTPFGGMS
jgi:phosphatidate phosphatase APP1